MERTAAYFAVENGRVAVSSRFLRPKVEHYNYDFFSGMDYVIDLRRPEGSRVAALRRHGREIAADEELLLCVNSYRASGTGGYDMLPALPLEKDIQQDVSELIIRYIEEKRDISVDRHGYLTVILPDCPGRRRAVTPVKGGRCALCPPREGYTASRRGQSRRRHMARAFFAPLAPSSIVHKRQKIPQMILPGCVDFPMNF